MIRSVCRPSWNDVSRVGHRSRCHHPPGIRTEGSRGQRVVSVVKIGWYCQKTQVDWFVSYGRPAWKSPGISSICQYQCHMIDLIPGSRLWTLPLLVWCVDCRLKLQDRPHLLMWLAYCYFHNGDYKKAIDAYDDAMRKAQFSETRAVEHLISPKTYIYI